MSITDELRKWGRATLADTSLLVRMEAIADRIDAEHQKALDEWKAKHGQMWLKGYSECHAELLEGNETLASDLERCGWIRLHKDAGGEYIHVGDEMEWVPYDDTYQTVVRKVVAVGADVFFAWSDEKHGYAQYEACAYRHHHAPTVEGLLREFAYGLGVPVADSYVAATAAKLRLAEGEDA